MSARVAWPLGVAAAAFALAVGYPARDPDMWWHLASGRWILEHRDLLRVDVYSSTAAGDPYALGEPLGQVLLYGVYALGSWVGIAVLRAACVAAAAFFLTRAALRAAPARVAVPLVAAALVLSSPTWSDRPQLFTLALFPAALDLLLAARDGSRRALVALVAVIAIWSVLHAGYALGVALLAIFAVHALVERRRAASFAIALAGAIAVSGVAPGALSLFRAVDHVGGATIGIVEESPVDVLTPFGALFAAFVGLTLLVLLLRGGSLLAALVLVPVLGLALSAQRHIPYFGFAAVVVLAGPVAGLVSDVVRVVRGRPFPLRGPGSSRRLGDLTVPLGAREGQTGSRTEAAPNVAGPVRDPVSAADTRAPGHPLRPDAFRWTAFFKGKSPAPIPAPLVIALWLAALSSIATAPVRPDERAYPAAAAQALRTSSGVLLNEYDWGGWLIWNVPERPVFVDGRLFPFLLNGVLSDYRRTISALPGWRDVMTRWNVRQVLLRPHRALVDALREEGWTVAAEGPTFVLLERPR